MRFDGKKLCGVTSLIVAGCLGVMTTVPAAAQVTIPEGSTIVQATFWIYGAGGWAPAVPPDAVTVHPIQSMWLENAVTWNSFMNALPYPGFDEFEVAGSFDVLMGWNSANITGLVQEWAEGTRPNYGIALKQGDVPYTRYYSSEAVIPALRPVLEIWYTTPSGADEYVIIQRPSDAQDGVADAYISEGSPDINWNSGILFTGLFNGYEKVSLIRFNFVVRPPSTGTGTPGFWKNHPDAWPVEGIEIGCQYFSKAEAIDILGSPVKGDKLISMFATLVSAKLNVEIGNDDSCIADTITEADDWMCQFVFGFDEVRAGGPNSPWKIGEPLHYMLDEYNNGRLCAPHRD